MNKSDRERSVKIGDHVRIFQRGTVWYAEFCDEGKQFRNSLKTKSMKEARRKAIQLEAKLANGTFVQEARVPTLAEVIDEYRSYLQTEGRAAATLAKYERAFSGAMTLAKKMKIGNILGVNLRFMDRYRKERVGGGAAPKTVHTDTVILRQVVNFAIQRQMIQRDPLRGLKIKKPKPTPQPYWSVGEVQQILAVTKFQYRGAFTLLAETGMRVGELCHLTWDDVGFEEGVLHIRPKAGWRPKSGDERVVPMSDAARAVLTALPRNGPWVFLSPASERYPKGDQKLSGRRMLEHLKRVLKRLGLKGHVHTFRHYFISSALVRSVPEAIVRRWVGHVDAEVMKRYTHIADRESREAMARLEQAKQADVGAGGLEAQAK